MEEERFIENYAYAVKHTRNGQIRVGLCATLREAIYMSMAISSISRCNITERSI